MITQNKAFQKAIAAFQQQPQGIFRTADAVRLGVHPRTLYAMRDAGVLEQLSRGLYRLTELPPLSSPDLVIIALKVPQAVVCLLSALSFYELSTQIPASVHIALNRHTERPRLDYPPLRLFRFSGAAFHEGIETHLIDDIPVRIYGVEKSIADSFKYRRKIGLDVALEALKTYRQNYRVASDKLLYYAQICRVETVMKPYLETLL